MRRVRLVLLIGCAASTLFAGTPEKWTDARNMGLQGPVHTQKLETKVLNEDPRIDPKLSIWSPIAWMVFDRRGLFVEMTSQLTADGSPQNVQRVEYDSEGRKTGAATMDQEWRTEYEYGPHGVTKSRTFNGDNLQYSQTTSYDDRGNAIEQASHTGTGELMNRSSSRYDAEGHIIDWTVIGPDEKLILHMVDRYDADGDLITREEFKTGNRLVRTITFRKSQPISWWQDSECQCSGGVGFNDPKSGVTTDYQIQPDGRLQTTVEKHEGRYGNIENDEMSRFGDNGQLLERLTFRYERDDRGNWTMRVVSAWDPQTGVAIPIREDRRVITYHQ